MDSILIKDFPKEERPRERFMQMGAESLTNQELIAILIQTGSKDESALAVANRLLHHFNGLRTLKDATLDELKAIKGIGTAKGLQLLAALELGDVLQGLPLRTGMQFVLLRMRPNT